MIFSLALEKRTSCVLGCKSSSLMLRTDEPRVYCYWWFLWYMQKIHLPHDCAHVLTTMLSKTCLLAHPSMFTKHRPDSILPLFHHFTQSRSSAMHQLRCDTHAVAACCGEGTSHEHTLHSLTTSVCGSLASLELDAIVYPSAFARSREN